jgi:hypothetical protein
MTVTCPVSHEEKRQVLDVPMPDELRRALLDGPVLLGAGL